MLEFTEKVVGNIGITITESDIENIVVSSLEGGSNSWMGLDNSHPEFKEKPKGEPLSTWTTKLLIDGKTVYFYDIEDPEEKLFELSLQKLFNGITQNAKERPFASNKDGWDACDADCIMQYALFGELVYG